MMVGPNPLMFLPQLRGHYDISATAEVAHTCGWLEGKCLASAGTSLSIESIWHSQNICEVFTSACGNARKPKYAENTGLKRLLKKSPLKQIFLKIGLRFTCPWSAPAVSDVATSISLAR